MSDDVLTKERAIDAARAAAFTVDDPDSSDHGRTLLHSFLGPIGCDWDLDAIETLISEAEAVGWADHMIGHDLCVQTNDGTRTRHYYFDVKRPVSA